MIDPRFPSLKAWRVTVKDGGEERTIYATHAREAARTFAREWDEDGSGALAEGDIAHVVVRTDPDGLDPQTYAITGQVIEEAIYFAEEIGS